VEGAQYVLSAFSCEESTYSTHNSDYIMVDKKVGVGDPYINLRIRLNLVITIRLTDNVFRSYIINAVGWLGLMP